MGWKLWSFPVNIMAMRNSNTTVTPMIRDSGEEKLFSCAYSFQQKEISGTSSNGAML